MTPPLGIASMQRFAQAALRSARDVGLLAVRVSLGVVLVAHGLRRWQVIGIENEIARLVERDVPTPDWLAWGAVVFEIVGGGLLVFGLGTIAIGLLVVVQQALIIGYLKLGNGLFLTNGGWEYNLALAALGLVTLLYGSGRLGVDHLFARRPSDEQQPLIDDQPSEDKAHSKHTDAT